jgi:hypothetical protein
MSKAKDSEKNKKEKPGASSAAAAEKDCWEPMVFDQGEEIMGLVVRYKRSRGSIGAREYDVFIPKTWNGQISIPCKGRPGYQADDVCIKSKLVRKQPFLAIQEDLDKAVKDKAEFYSLKMHPVADGGGGGGAKSASKADIHTTSTKSPDKGVVFGPDEQITGVLVVYQPADGKDSYVKIIPIRNLQQIDIPCVGLDASYRAKKVYILSARIRHQRYNEILDEVLAKARSNKLMTRVSVTIPC